MPPAPTAASWWWSPANSTFPPAPFTMAVMASSSAVDDIPASSTTTRSRGPIRNRTRPCSSGVAPARNTEVFTASSPSSRRLAVAISEVARPSTRPPIACSQVPASSPTVWDFPVPAGPIIASARRPDAMIPTTASTWSPPRPAAASSTRSISSSGPATIGAPLAWVAATTRASTANWSAVA